MLCSNRSCFSVTVIEIKLFYSYCLDITKLHNCFHLLQILKHYGSKSAVGRNQIENVTVVSNHWKHIEVNFPFSKPFFLSPLKNEKPSESPGVLNPVDFT